MRTTPARRSTLKPYLLGGAVAAFAGLGVLMTLWWLHILEPPWHTHADEPEPRPALAGPPPGTVAVPVTARPVPAYTRITRDDFWDGKNGRFAVVYLKPEQVRPGMLTDVTKIIGRVTAHDKQANYAFLESELLPAGTRPGVGAGVDSTRRGMFFDAARLQGIHGLKAGDRVDLVIAQALDPRSAPGGPRNSVVSAGVVPAGGTKRAQVTVLAHDAVVVTPVLTRAEPGRAGQANQARGPTHQEVFLAVRVDDVPRVTEAVGLGLEVACWVRSNLPGGASEEEVTVPEPRPPSVTVVETFRGSRRDVVVFPQPEKE